MGHLYASHQDGPDPLFSNLYSQQHHQKLVMKATIASDLAQKTRTELPDEKITMLAALQNCKTICRYLDRLDNNKWIDYEIKGYPVLPANTADGEYEIPEYRYVYQTFYAGSMQVQISSDLAPILGKMPLYKSIAEILQYEMSGMAVTTSPALDRLNSEEFREEYDMPHEPRVSHGTVPKGQIAKVISGVQDKIYEFLDNLILELEYGKIPETIFETIRKEVDEKFRNVCPVAMQKLIFIYEQLDSDNTVVYSQIASTCRQIIKDVANSLYPPKPQSDKNDNDMQLTEDKYLNRLSMAISSSTGRKTFRAMHEYTTRFLHIINDYASKGDHNQFQQSDAVRCVVYTYILLGDILHYHTSNNISTK